MSSKIHHTAIIESKSSLGEGVSVGPYAIVEEGSEIGDNSVLESHSVIKKWARIGKNVRVGHFSVVGGDPQHLDFDRQTQSFASIGSNSRLGEGVTVHRSIRENQTTTVGSETFLMTNSHVAHDCILEKRVILANGVLLGGHVEIGEQVFVGGGTAVHQFVRIGKGAMIGGLAEISKDVGPNLLVVGRNQAYGLNLVGLKRRGVEEQEIQNLKRLFKELLLKPVSISKLAKDHLENPNFRLTSLSREFLEFYQSGTRGFARYQKE